MVITSILDAIFDFKNKENCAEGVIENIFLIIKREKNRHSHIFDFIYTKSFLLSKQCSSIQEFENLYSDLLRQVLNWFYKKPLKVNDCLIAQIFYLTFEFLKISISRFSPVNFKTLKNLLKKRLLFFLSENFDLNKFEDYLRGFNPTLTNKKSHDLTLGLVLFCSSFLFTTYLLN